MTLLATRTTRAPRPARQRTFSVQFVIDGTAYAIGRLQPDPDVAQAAFSFRKLGGDAAVYHVRVTEHGPECECLGYLRHRRCKHCETLQAAGAVFTL